MNNRIVPVLLVAIGLTFAAAPVFAHKEDGCDHGWGENYEYDGSARFEKHMTRLHDSLKLTKDQEAAWTEFSDTMKPAKTEKTERPDWKSMNTPDRLDKMLGLMKAREQKLADRAAAIRKFYGTLKPDQQKTFDHRFEAYHQRDRHHAHGMNKPMPEKSMGKSMPDKSMPGGSM